MSELSESEKQELLAELLELMDLGLTYPVEVQGKIHWVGRKHIQHYPLEMRLSREEVIRHYENGGD